MSPELLDTEGLSPKQEEAIVALLKETTIAKAAEAIDVHVRTVYRWMKEPAFSRAYREARRQAFAHAISLTQHYAPMAIHALAKIMTDSTAPHSARASAASSILKFSRESIEIDDLCARIEALEEDRLRLSDIQSTAA